MEPTTKQLNFLSKSGWRLAYLERDIRVAKGEQEGEAILKDTSIINREIALTDHSIDETYADIGLMSVLIDTIRRKIELAQQELETLGDYCPAHKGKIMAKCNNGGCA